MVSLNSVLEVLVSFRSVQQLVHLIDTHGRYAKLQARRQPAIIPLFQEAGNRVHPLPVHGSNLRVTHLKGDAAAAY